MNTGRHLISHGAEVSYMFRVESSYVILKCVYDCTKYPSPASQIIDENPEYFNRIPMPEIICGTIVRMNKLRPIRRKQYLDAIEILGTISTN